MNPIKENLIVIELRRDAFPKDTQSTLSAHSTSDELDTT